MKQKKSAAVDPVTLGLVRNYLSSVADEMANTVIRTAYSTIIRDCMDFSTALCDKDGQMVAQGVTIPFHLGSIPFALGSTIQKYRDRIFPEDIFIMNDPFEGGIHLPDIFIFKPIFHRKKLIGFAAVVAHHLDVGGRVPGSAACDNTEIFQEGLRIPPLKLYERGEANESLFQIIEKNVRIPTLTLGDLQSSIAACRSGERGMLELAEKYGTETLECAFGQLLDYTEELFRAEIRKWPSGEYSFTDYLDDDGVDPAPIPIQVKIIVKGDSVVVDFTGTSPQVRGGINCPLPFTVSCCGYALRSIMRVDIPNTSGLFRPMKIIAAEGSILNPVMPAASSMRGVVGFRLSDALFGALAQISPSSVPAAGEGGNSLVIVGGYYADRKPFIMFDLVAGTWGGRPDKDGNDGLTNPGSVVSNIPAELMELEYPVRIEQYGLVQDSGGAGKYRGGLAVIRDWRYFGDQRANLTIRSDRRAFPPYGLNGGMCGSSSWNIVNPGTKTEQLLPTKVTHTLSPGDLIRHVQPGGGGWGDPLERDPVSVVRDVLNEKISRLKAEELYCVVFQSESLAVDLEGTRLRRKASQADRNPPARVKPERNV